MECRRCGRRLSDPQSIKAGIGPICAAKERVERDQSDLFGFEYDQNFNLPFNPKTGDIICKRDPRDEFRVAFNFPHKIKQHSPTGMEWGYCGSGPADFALNVLLMFVPEGIARQFYQQFKMKFVAGLPKEGGIISGKLIRNFLIENIKDESVNIG